MGSVAPSPKRRPSVLTVAGSDSSGGAGIQADLKTMEALGVFGQCAITALTAQNTCGVIGVEAASPEFVALQIKAVFEDIRPQAVKVGMLGSSDIACAVADELVVQKAENVVLDPVMVATSGASLSGDATVRAMCERLVPLAAVLTPNLPEAEALAGFEVRTRHDMERAAHAIVGGGARAVLVKGGHRGVSDGQGRESACDCLLEADGVPVWFESPFVVTPNTHGTGCTLSSAIASFLARGMDLRQAVGAAKAYVSGALEHDLCLGRGNGPLNHAWMGAE